MPKQHKTHFNPDSSKGLAICGRNLRLLDHWTDDHIATTCRNCQRVIQRAFDSSRLIASDKASSVITFEDLADAFMDEKEAVDARTVTAADLNEDDARYDEAGR